MKCTVATLVALLSGTLSPTVYSQELLDLETVEAAILDQVSRANQQLRDLSPPRYRIQEVIVTLHLKEEKTVAGGISFKIPLLIAAEITPEYEKVQTITRSYTYVPRDEVPVTEPLGLHLKEDIAALHAKLHDQIARNVEIIIKKASTEISFIVTRSAGGKLSFLEAAEVGGGIATENMHSIEVIFCLEGEDGRCA